MNLTTKLNNGAVVLAKLYNGKPSALQYMARAQAEKKAAAVGGKAVRFAAGRAYYVVFES